MSENKNVTKSLDAGIDIINAGGFEKGQMQAVVAKDSDWLIEKLQGDSVTNDEFFKAWTTGSNHQEKRFFLIDSYSPELFEETVDRSRVVMLKSPCDQSSGGFDGDISKFLSIKHLPISPPDPNFDGVFKKERYNASCLDPEVINKLRSACIIKLVQSDARIAIVVSDDPKYLKKKFRTWVKLYPNDLNRNINAGPNSKFVFVVENINELPIIAGYQACVILKIHKVAGTCLVLKANAPTGLIFKTSENLEHYLNKFSSKDLSEYYLFKAPAVLKLTPKHYLIPNDCQ